MSDSFARSWLTLTKPESTTYLTPSIVTDASATFVLIMTLRERGGGGSKTAIWLSVERPECNGSALMRGAPCGSLGDMIPVSRQCSRCVGSQAWNALVLVVRDLLQAAIDLFAAGEEDENIPRRLLQREGKSA